MQATLPLAYIIPVEWQDVIKRLGWHGINYFTISKETEIEVDSYKFKNVSWQSTPYEGRQVAQFESESIQETRNFPKGSVVVPMDQRTAKVIANILEPHAPDSFVYWGFFNAIFERKEYVESYVMEEYARMMLKTDENLANAFDKKMQSDSTFAADPRAILMWFYQNSPYWDSKKDVYPVGKIYSEVILSSLKNN